MAGPRGIIEHMAKCGESSINHNFPGQLDKPSFLGVRLTVLLETWTGMLGNRETLQYLHLISQDECNTGPRRANEGTLVIWVSSVRHCRSRYYPYCHQPIDHIYSRNVSISSLPDGESTYSSSSRKNQTSKSALRRTFPAHSRPCIASFVA